MLSSLSPATYMACDIGGSQQYCVHANRWWLSLWREAAFQASSFPCLSDQGTDSSPCSSPPSS